MRVVAFNGSPRPQGNTSLLIGKVFEALQAEGIETELVQVGGNLIRGCQACGACFKNANGKCVFDDDILNECVAKAREADGLIIGSPTYYANVSAETKALIDRTGFVNVANGGFLKHKVGAPVVAVRRAGALPVFDAINHFFHLAQMVMTGAAYWNLGIGREVGEVLGDEEGLRTMETLGQNMAWLLKKLHA